MLTDFSRGLDRSRPPFLIDDGALFDATNFYYDPTTGYPTTRPGLKKYSAAAMPAGVIGIYEVVIGGVSTIVAVCEDQKLYKLDGAKTPQEVGSLAGGERPSFCTMNGKLVVCTGGIQTSDLATISAGMTNFKFIADWNKGAAMDAFVCIMGVGDPTVRERFGMSAVKDPEDWAYAAAPENAAKYMDVGYNDGMDAIGVMPFRGDAFVFKKSPYAAARAIYRAVISGATSTWSLVPLSRSATTLSPHFLVEVNDLFFMDLEGPKRLFPVEGFSDFPFKIDTWGRNIAGEISRFLQGDGFSFYDPVFQIIMTKPTKNSSRFYCVNPYDERWTYFQYAPNIQSGAYCLGKMLFGGSDGWIYEYDTSSYLDEGVQYPMTLETKWFDLSTLFRNIVKGLYLNVVGLVSGSLTMTVKVGGIDKMTKVHAFDDAWWSWDLVNSITPEEWTESLTKTLSGILRDNRPVSADQVSIHISVTSGLAAIGHLGGRLATTGRI